MSPKLPICCNPVAFDAMSSIARGIDEPHALLPAAVMLSMSNDPKALIASTEQRISEMAREVSGRVQGTQTQALVAHLHDYLFDEMGFEGNASDYHNPENSSLPRVLETRRGLPIVLSLIYKLVGERIGLNVWGVGLPGHFIAGLELDGHTVWVDTFAGGRIITLAEAKARVAAHFGTRLEWSDRLIDPVSNRYWITRILQNLLTSYSKQEMFEDLAAVLEVELLLWPDESRLQRDLAVVLARTGKQEMAALWLEHYLSQNPDDPQKADLRQMIANM